jgi:hypothetical protein
VVEKIIQASEEAEAYLWLKLHNIKEEGDSYHQTCRDAHLFQSHG